MVARAYELKDFSQIVVDGPQDISIIRGDEFKIEASGRLQDLDRTALNQNGQTLEIKKNYPWQLCIFCFTRLHPLTFKITMPALESFKAKGFYKADISGFNEENLALQVDGVGETSANIFARNLSLDMNGVSKMILTGSSTAAQIKLDGVANLDASNFQIKKIQISTNGASHASLWPLEKLDAKADGTSHVYYKGTPAVTQDIKGASHLQATQ